MDLETILDASAEPSASNGAPDIARARTLLPVTDCLIQDETAETAYLALAEHYDTRRDNAVEKLARVVAAYGKEVEQRGQGMTSAVATPLLAEVRRYLDAADKCNTSAARNRAHYNNAK